MPTDVNKILKTNAKVRSVCLVYRKLVYTEAATGSVKQKKCL